MKKIDFSKSYCATLYCEKICHNCYCFGTSWDIRCKENRQPINQVVNNCSKFKNAKKINDEIIEKMLSDDDFYNFCKVYNEKKMKGRYGNYYESLFEIFLGIFNEFIFDEDKNGFENKNELKFKNR